MLERMQHKRLNGYASLGYKMKGELMAPESVNFIFDKSNFYPVYSNDIVSAHQEILVISPFVTRRRVEQMRWQLRDAVNKGMRVTVITRRSGDFKEKDRPILDHVFDSLKGDGIDLQFRSGIHQKCEFVDRRIVWYGSVNLLGFGGSEETMMRTESSNIASELLESLNLRVAV